MPADVSDKKKLAPGDDPSWSPDWKKVIHVWKRIATSVSIGVISPMERISILRSKRIVDWKNVVEVEIVNGIVTWINAVRDTLEKSSTRTSPRELLVEFKLL